MPPPLPDEGTEKITYVLATSIFSAVCSVLVIFFVVSWSLPNYERFFSDFLAFLAFAFVTGLGISLISLWLNAPPTTAMIGAVYGWSLALPLTGIVVISFFEALGAGTFLLQVPIGIILGIIPSLIWKLFHRKG